jgi:hypothetical protein
MQRFLAPCPALDWFDLTHLLACRCCCDPFKQKESIRHESTAKEKAISEVSMPQDAVT